MQIIVEPDFLRPREACELLRVGRTFLWKQERRGRLHPSRLSARITLYARAELLALIDDARADGNPAPKVATVEPQS